MGLFSGVCSIVGAAVNFIGSCMNRLGSNICTFGQKILSPFPNIDIAIRVIDAVVKIVKYIGKELGLIEKEEQIDEIGAKAMQEDSLARDKFKSNQEYIEYLRNKVELDIEKFNKKSPEEKVACKAVGVAIVTRAIEEKTGIELPPEFLLNAEKIKLSGQEVKTFIEKFKENGFNNMGIMTDYLQKNNDKSNSDKISATIGEGLKENNPKLSDDEVENKIIDMILESRNNEK